MTNNPYRPLDAVPHHSRDNRYGPGRRCSAVLCLVAGKRDTDDEDPVDHRFVSTDQVRVREKNPQIERKAGLRHDSQTMATVPTPSPNSSLEREPHHKPPRRDDRPQPPSVPHGAKSPNPTDLHESLYDRIELADEPEALAAAQARLEAALWAPPDIPSAEASAPTAAPEAPSERLIPRLVRPARVPLAPANPPPARAETRSERPPPSPAAPPKATRPSAREDTVPLRRPKLSSAPAAAPLDDDETELSGARPHRAPATLEPSAGPASRQAPLSGDRFSDLSDAARAELQAIFRVVSIEDQTRLGRLVRRQVAGRSAVEDRTVHGTLLTHLRALVEQTDIDPWWPAHGLRIEAVNRLILETLASPARLSPEVGADEVLGFIEYVLAESTPAELTQLWRSLLGAATEVEFKGGLRILNDDLRRAPKAATPLRALLRHLISVPGDALALPTPGGLGLNADRLTAVMSQLVGVDYAVVVGAREIRANLAEASSRRHPILVSIRHSAGERLFLFDRLDETFLYVRGPVGGSRRPRGAQRSAPDREVVDPEQGLDRIFLTRFHQSAGTGLFPQPAANERRRR